MTDLHYEVVQHDGGWAYRLSGVYSETFPTRDLALAAAEQAAMRQGMAGTTRSIMYQDAAGAWHHELARGDDHPQADVR